MKRFFVMAAVSAMLVVSCGKDEITEVDVADSSVSGGSTIGSYDDFTADRVVSIVYADGSATVSGAGSGQTVSRSGAGVTITNSGTEKVRYEVSGASSDGWLKIYSSAHQALVLDGLTLTNSTGAAINLQGASETHTTGKTTFVVLQSASSIADGSSYTATPSDEDEKAALFAEGSIVVCGSGSLTVNAKGKSGIASDDEIEIQSGSVTVNSTAATKATSGDTLKVSGVKAQDGFIMTGGTLTVSCSGTGAKGISGDGTAVFNGGSVTVTVTGSNFGSSSSGGWGGGGGHGPGGGGHSSSDNSVGAKAIKFDGAITFNGGTVVATAQKHEAIEGKSTMTINGGEVYGYSASDDGINCASTLTVNNGYVCAISAGNDGMDANGNLYIKGGFVMCASANSPEVGIDANTEGGYKLYIEGGTLVSMGGIENNSQLTQSCWRTSSWSKNTWYSITVGSTTHAFKTPSTSGSGMVVSGASEPTLKSGVSASGGTERLNGTVLESPEVSGGSSVSLSSYSGGGGGWGW